MFHIGEKSENFIYPLRRRALKTLLLHNIFNFLFYQNVPNEKMLQVTKGEAHSICRSGNMVKSSTIFYQNKVLWGAKSIKIPEKSKI